MTGFSRVNRKAENIAKMTGFSRVNRKAENIAKIRHTSHHDFQCS
jgi:hypothetical protein